MKNRVLERISYHAVYDNSVLSALQYAHENGFKGVQLADESPHLSFERLSDQNLDAINAFIEKTGVNISLHAPDEAALPRVLGHTEGNTRSPVMAWV